MPILGIIAAVILAYWIWADGQPHPFLGQPKIPPHPWGEFIPGDRVIIIGLPLSGKTYLAAKLTKTAQRVLYFDPYHDYSDAADAIEITADQLIDDPKLLNVSEFRYAIIPDEDYMADQLEDVVTIARAAGNLVLVMDEVGDYKREAALTLEKLARNGRHNGIVPVYVSQVAMDIPRTVRRIATRVYSFRQEDIDDLDALSERYGEKYAQKVSQLPLHEYELWTLKGFSHSRVPSQSQTPPQSPSQKETQS